MSISKSHFINANNHTKNLIGIIFPNFLSYYVLQ